MAGTSGNGSSPSDDVVTMPDYLALMLEREKEARQVLGGSDDTNCSYPVGYVKRQVVYSCLTCAKSPGDPGGVCLACANHCHDNHHLVELYTKRNFRCDCGNSKHGNRCRLCPDKDDANVLNVYNHNFIGEYCFCRRPYPDPVESFTKRMLQCVICEDWYHENHLGRPCVATDDDKEMICSYCVNKYPFLRSYEAKEAQPTAEAGVDHLADDGSDSSESDDDGNWEFDHAGDALLDMVEDHGNVDGGLDQGDGVDVDVDDGDGEEDDVISEGGTESDDSVMDGENLVEPDVDNGLDGGDGQELDLPLLNTPANSDGESSYEGSEDECMASFCTAFRKITKDRAIFMRQNWRIAICRYVILSRQGNAQYKMNYLPFWFH